MNEQLRNMAQIMNATSCRWGFCGGWGLDLYLGRQTRSHQDIDIAVFRRDQQVLRERLTVGGWTLRKVKDRIATAWERDERLDPPCHEVWCGNAAFDPPKFELLFNESDGEQFICRRDAWIRLPVDQAICMTASGLPVLAPQIVLLYKSKDFQSPRNVADLNHAMEHLDSEGRRWLAAALMRLHAQHPWTPFLIEPPPR